jgi:hypothetical protein
MKLGNLGLYIRLQFAASGKNEGARYLVFVAEIQEFGTVNSLLIKQLVSVPLASCTK